MEQPKDREKSVPKAEMEALRELLFKKELEKIRWLESQAGRYPTTEAVARALPEAVSMASQQSGRLGEALTEPIESALHKSVQENPQPLIEVLFPILGPMIRKAVASALEGMSQSLNQATTYSLNPAFRFKAWKSGMPFAEYVILQTLVYRVEQLFLIHRETSLVLAHVSQAEDTQDPDMVASMLSAIQQFAVDSFDLEGSDSLDAFKVGELNVHILMSPNVALAAVVRGTLPVEQKTRFQELLESIEFRYAYQLDSFEGDEEPFQTLVPELDKQLVLKREAPKARLSPGALAILSLVATLAILGLVLLGWANHRWTKYVDSLEENPGILVTRTEKEWKFAWDLPPLRREYRVYGLRDPLSRDPEEVKSDFWHYNPHTKYFWEPFQSDHSLLLRQRVKRQLHPPRGVTLKIDEDGVVRASGRADADWIREAKMKAALLPGVTRYEDKYLEDINPMVRIRKKLRPPSTVELSLSGKTLSASGKASNAWIQAARKAVEADHIEDLELFDDSTLENLEIARIQALKKRIEGRSVFFHSGTANPSGDSSGVVRGVAKDWKQLDQEAKSVGYQARLEVTGQSDATGAPEDNRELSLKRARKMRDALVAQGVAAESTSTQALQSSEIDPRLRRVQFLVILDE